MENTKKTQKIDVQKLYQAYKQRGVQIRKLFLWNVVSLLLWIILLLGLAIYFRTNKEAEIKPEIETHVLQLIPENMEVKEIELEEVKLPPLPPILTKS